MFRYDLALERLGDSADPVGTAALLNRSHANLQIHRFDAADKDAMEANVRHRTTCSDGRPLEKGLFRAARALYALQRFDECLNILKDMLRCYPSNTAGWADLKRCMICIKEQQGEYDWKAMLEEALSKAPNPNMDRATYVGPIKSRKCRDESCGRGLFTTKDVEAGELLLCEKSFAVVFRGSNHPDHANSKHDHSKMSKVEKAEEERDQAFEMHAKLGAEAIVKLEGNPSLVTDFARLYAGPDEETKTDAKTKGPLVDV